MNLLNPLIRSFHFARIAGRNSMAHRGRLIARFCFCMVFAIIFVELWRTIFREDLAEFSFSLVEVSWYCTLTQMFLFISSRLFITIEEDMRSGNIAYFLTKPMAYVWMRLSEGIGGMSVNFAFYATFGMIAMRLYIGEWPEAGMHGVIIGFLCLWVASVLHLVMQVATGLSALWLHDAETIYRVYQKFLIICGGLYMPIAIYPNWAQDIIAWTPFIALMAGTASLVFEQPVMSFTTLLLNQAAWMLVLLSCASGFYGLALKKVEVNGG